jgi:hypothetical protein
MYNILLKIFSFLQRVPIFFKILNIELYDCLTLVQTSNSKKRSLNNKKIS